MSQCISHDSLIATRSNHEQKPWVSARVMIHLPQEVIMNKSQDSASESRFICHKKWKVEQADQTSACQCSASTLRKLLRMYCSGHAGVKGTDRADRLVGKQPSQAACTSENLKCWGAWDTKPKTSHHWLLGGEKSRKRKCLMIFLERTRTGNCQSDKHWNTFRQQWAKTSDYQWGLPKLIDTTLNWTELNRSHITSRSVCLSESFD